MKPINEHINSTITTLLVDNMNANFQFSYVLDYHKITHCTWGNVIHGQRIKGQLAGELKNQYALNLLLSII